jgi:hypothetical protein
MGEKAKIKLYPGSRILIAHSEVQIPKQKYSFSLIAEKLTKIIAVLSALSLLISLVLGIILSQIYYSKFGIPYIDLANSEDYIRASLSKFGVISPYFLVLVVILSTKINFDIHKEKLWRFCAKNIKLIKICGFVFLCIFLLLLVVSKTSFKKYLPELTTITSGEWEQHSRSYRDSVKAIKLGHEGIFEVEYGKDLLVKSCLVFIAKVGEHTYYWSLIEDSLFSINTANLITSNQQLSAKPFPSRGSPTRTMNKFPNERYFLDSEYGKIATQWEVEKINICPKPESK